MKYSKNKRRINNRKTKKNKIKTKTNNLLKKSDYQIKTYIEYLTNCLNQNKKHLNIPPT